MRHVDGLPENHKECAYFIKKNTAHVAGEGSYVPWSVLCVCHPLPRTCPQLTCATLISLLALVIYE